MFIKSKNFIAKFRIDLGEELGAEKAEDAYVVLRECNTLELMDLQSAESVPKKLLEMIPALMIEHNFFESETAQMKAEDVAATICAKPVAAMKVLREYLEKVTSPFQSKTEQK